MMRYNKDFFDMLEEGDFTGSNRPSGRVTVEADWILNKTTNGGFWANSIRGPYRWWQRSDTPQVEIEVPNVATITWDRNLSQDIASCNISLYNQWHDPIGQGAAGSVIPKDLQQLGNPGYFWPGHGNAESQLQWDQDVATGGTGKDGTDYPSFSWQSALVPYALLRTYEGYGGHDKTIDQALTDGDIFQTGVWLIETVTAGTDGMLELSCKDIGKLLLDQIVDPPLIPPALYPLEYVPDGKSAFDSYWEPPAKGGSIPASQGRVPMSYHSSGSTPSNFTWNNGAAAIDLKDASFAQSAGFATPTEGTYYIQFINKGGSKQYDQVSIRPWAGGYTCYVSVYNGSWQGSGAVPGSGISYSAKATIPLAIPDGKEQEVNISLPSTMTGTMIRLTFTNGYHSGTPTNPYKVGVREFKAWRVNTSFAPNYGNPLPSDPWTYAMCAHPTRGYWVCEDSGYIHGFGDATDYDLGALSDSAVGMAAHPSGEGGWVLTRDGVVYPFGVASGHGWWLRSPGTDIWGAQGTMAFDIAATHTGNGYYVVYGDGKITGWGDAASTPGFLNIGGGVIGANLPQSQVDVFMAQVPITILVAANNPLGFVRQDVYNYTFCRRGTSCDSHPFELGVWVTTGSGEVYTYGASQHYGQLYQRTYNPGGADSFKLTTTEFTHSIRCTTTGNGYWITFGSGHIAAYGDAIGQGPTDIYENHPGTDFNIPIEDIRDFSFFKALIWALEPDPDGSGFWLLAADGSVGHHNAEFWGQPGYYGRSGYRWFEGNYEDYTDIVKDLLLWSGWLLYNPSDQNNSSIDPPVFGSLENTGIPSDAEIDPSLFDKKTIVDCINEMKQIVGYSFWIDWDGSAIYTSPNWWQAGNIDNSNTGFSGGRIYVDGSGVQTNNPADTLFIPEISEELTLLNYSTTLSAEQMRSQVIIGNNKPDWKDPSSTGFVRYYPNTAFEEIRPGVPALRGIHKPITFVKEQFENTEEMQLMAELINAQIWFSQRVGSATTVGNPLLSINDQVTIKERNTSETFLHYIRGISSSNNLDTGEYTMGISTNWLGTEDNWVITADSSESSYNKLTISNRVDRWQQVLGLGLGTSNTSTNEDVQLLVTGQFDSATTIYSGNYAPEWKFTGTITTPVTITGFVANTWQYSDILGDATITIYSGATPVQSVAFAKAGETTTFADLAAGSYTYEIVGTPTAAGGASLSLQFNGDSVLPDNATDTILVVQIAEDLTVSTDAVADGYVGTTTDVQISHQLSAVSQQRIVDWNRDEVNLGNTAGHLYQSPSGVGYEVVNNDTLGNQAIRREIGIPTTGYSYNWGWNYVPTVFPEYDTQDYGFYARTYFQIPENPSIDVNVMLVANGSQDVMTGIKLTTTGALRLMDGAITGDWALTTISPNTWYSLAIYYDDLNDQAEARVYSMDGTQLATSGLQTLTVTEYGFPYYVYFGLSPLLQTVGGPPTSDFAAFNGYFEALFAKEAMDFGADADWILPETYRVNRPTVWKDPLTPAAVEETEIIPEPGISQP